MTPKKDNTDKELQLIEELAVLLKKHDLGELTLERKDVHIHLAQRQSVTPFATALPNATALSLPPAAESGQVAAKVEDYGGNVTAPLVGTVYVAPEPSSPPFVKKGDEVTQDQTLLIVEAMKTMNPVTAHLSGRIKDILIKDGEPVEYGQILMIIQPS